MDNIHGLSDDVNREVRRILKAVEKRRKLGEETRQRILSLIAESEPAGMTTKELVKATGRDRRTVHGICSDYQKRGLILPKTRRYGKYHLTDTAKRIDDPSIGSLFVHLHMVRTGLFGLGEVSLTSSMDFCEAAYPQRILEEYQKNPGAKQQKEALGKFFLFEFALRLGASILYSMIQSMKYANPSLSINESIRNQLITKRFETAVNPTLLKSTFDLLLIFLEERLWKGYSIPRRPTPPPPSDEEMENVNEKLLKEADDEMESFPKKLMKERFEEMESIYKKTFPIVFEAIQKIGYDMVYEPGLLEVERMEKEDPHHIKCGGELMPQIDIDPYGRRGKKCIRCKRWIPVEDSKPQDL